MFQIISRTAIAALVGAIAGGVCLAVAFMAHPSFTLEMDRDFPRLVSGFYPVERAAELTFAWTSERATLTLPGLSRRRTWQCHVRLRGGRPEGVPLPTIDIEIDGVAIAHRQLTNEFEDIVVTVPVRPIAGLRLGIVNAPTFSPGPGDGRDLGSQVDRIGCAPARGWILPPRSAIVSATQAGAIVGAGVGLAGVSTPAALGAAVVVAAAQAFPLSSG